VSLLDSTISRSAAALAAALLLSCAHAGHDEHVTAGVPFSDDRTIIQVVTTNAGGKNFFVPSTIVLTAGAGRSLSIFNTTDQPHGLKIPGLGIETVLLPQAETKVDLPPLEGGHIYAVQCHLHPPHREASLVVLPAKPTS
jgi:hypothetical protein